MSWQGLLEEDSVAASASSASGLRRARTLQSLKAMMREVAESVLAEKAADKLPVVTVPPVGAGNVTVNSLPLDPVITMGGMVQTGILPIVPFSGSFPLHILLRWPWVDAETINLIQLGRFEIESLPKLHQTDELRNAYIKKSVKGVLHPLDSGPSEILIGTMRLQASFRDSINFYLAWQVYISIRTTFHPERASGLALWTSRLHFFESLNYPWPGILEYIIAYYKLNQNAVPDSWFDPNTILISQCLTLHQQRQAPHQSNVGGPKPGGGSKSSGGSKMISSAAKSSDEICINFNRPAGCLWPQKNNGQTCPHRHVCNRCISDQHGAQKCPKRPVT
jgi:hypothetical protein